MQTNPNTRHVKKALNSLDFLVEQEIFMSETAKFANFVLPGASFFEKSGTFTNGERRVQHVHFPAPLPGRMSFVGGIRGWSLVPRSTPG